MSVGRLDKPRPQDLGKASEQLVTLEPTELMKLPPPYDAWEEPAFEELTDDQKSRLEHSLDGHVAIGMAKPAGPAEKERMVAGFLDGLRKLLSKENNWTFLQPLLVSLENCVGCQTCAESCPVFLGSGRAEIYRPTFRADVLRKIARKYLKPGGKVLAKFTGSDIDLNWDTLARLAELAYRCTLCRRCAQACPMGVDNALLTREIRKLFSQELGIHVDALHGSGTQKQLSVGSSTGINPDALMDLMAFAEEDITDRTGLELKIPFDKSGADILVMHNAGEFLAWPENLQAFTILFEAAGVSWTLSSDLVGYDSVNYGLFYDDVQYARIAMKHMAVAKKLGVKKIVIGECGHAHKALMPIADRVLTGDLFIPRESCMTVLRDIVLEGRLKLDPSRNDFPVTLHDPCNLVRSMGIVEPQREILRKICPQFREMTPHGVNNYCCGGGSGFAIFQSMNFPQWRNRISSRMKFKQILEVFQDRIGPETNKYVCAPCSNCKGAIRDMLVHYEAWDRCRISYGGLVELIVNAMADLKEPFLEWQDLH